MLISLQSALGVWRDEAKGLINGLRPEDLRDADEDEDSSEDEEADNQGNGASKSRSALSERPPTTSSATTASAHCQPLQPTSAVAFSSTTMTCSRVCLTSPARLMTLCHAKLRSRRFGIAGAWRDSIPARGEETARHLCTSSCNLRILIPCSQPQVFLRNTSRTRDTCRPGPANETQSEWRPRRYGNALAWS